MVTINALLFTLSLVYLIFPLAINNTVVVGGCGIR